MPEPGTEPTIDELRESLDRDGYVIFDPGIEESVIDGAVSEIQAEFRTEGSLERTARRARRALGGRGRTLSHRDEIRVQDAWVISESVKRIALAPRVLELLRSAYEREPLAFQTINFRRRHSAGAHIPTRCTSTPSPPASCAACGSRSRTSTTHNGPLVYYPGSHRLAEVTMRRVSSPGCRPGADYEDFVDRADRTRGDGGRTTATIRKGQALLWASNLLHGGAPQTDRRPTRWSQVTHYFFEGCRYWKPLASDREHREYWQPTWVR